ncbi:MAG: phosphatidate cytidylyltransferase [Gammaproteobacteria bacterium]|nr:phosphatidate cytidylyltransferase [Gammaproteobacteria bacterium]
MLIKRTITAIVLLLFVIGGILYLPEVPFNLLALLIIFLAAWEYANLFWKKKPAALIIFLLVILALYFGLRFINVIPLLIISAAWWVIAPIYLWRFSLHSSLCLKHVLTKMLVGWLIFLPALVSLIEIRQFFGNGFLLVLLVTVWATDTGAYFTGRMFGKRQLAAKISPKKTVEGLFGGIILAMIVAVFSSFILKISGIKLLLFLTLVLITSLWSVIGDLFESMLKRQVQVKDSGSFLPGHGGVYDRIDSLTAAAPIYALGLIFLLNY